MSKKKAVKKATPKRKTTVVAQRPSPSRIPVKKGAQVYWGFEFWEPSLRKGVTALKRLESQDEALFKFIREKEHSKDPRDIADVEATQEMFETIESARHIAALDLARVVGELLVDIDQGNHVPRATRARRLTRTPERVDKERKARKT